MNQSMSRSEFLQLPTEQVAEMIRGLTIAFPIDGTRRWFRLHYPQARSVEEYKQLVVARYVQVYRMLFEHGVETLIIPVFGRELLNRGEEYVREAMEAMTRLAEQPLFTDFYREYNVRVIFYGDWRRQARGLPGADAVTAAFDGCTASRHTGPRRIFYGAWADDMLVSLADDLARSQRDPLEFTRKRSWPAITANTSTPLTFTLALAGLVCSTCR
jgi:hypothetical protein